MKRKRTFKVMLGKTWEIKNAWNIFQMFFQRCWWKDRHLNYPIFINQKIGGLQISVYYHWGAVVQIIHSPSLKNSIMQKRTSNELSRINKIYTIWYLNIGQNLKNHTASKAILKRLRSSNWLLGRWSNLYKLPLQNISMVQYTPTNMNIWYRKTTALNSKARKLQLLLKSCQ